MGNKTYLPDKGTAEYKELERLYPIADDTLLRAWAKKYGYRNKKAFIGSVRDGYGLYRLPVLGNQGWEPSEINVALTLDTEKKLRTFAIINDTHNPYQDVPALHLVERFLQDIQFHYLIYNGDVNDMYQISTFNRNPERVSDMQKDINNTKVMFEKHNRLFPDVKKVMTEGNHEHRLQKFLWTKAPEFAGITALSISELFDLKGFGIKHIAYEQGLMINSSFLVTHGEIASVHSGYTAKRTYEKHGGNGMVGHCHRGGSYYKTDRFGTHGWWENFCLCSLYPDWIKSPNWQHGFSLVHFLGKRFWVEQIPIIENKLIYGGKLYE